MQSATISRFIALECAIIDDELTSAESQVVGVLLGFHEQTASICLCFVMRKADSCENDGVNWSYIDASTVA